MGEYGSLAVVCGLVLLAGGVAGFAFTETPTTSGVDAPGQSVASGQADTGATSPIELSFLSVFTTNAAVVVTLVLGSFTFGLLTVGVLGFNGYILGVLAKSAVASGDGTIFLALLVPHAVFELPALFFAGAVGLRIPKQLYDHLTGRRETVLDHREMREIATIIGISLSLLFVAAAIESQLTARLAEQYASQ